MFAIAICDLRGDSPSLFLARDHFGIKPLYYCQQGAKFAFASEIKSLLRLPDLARKLNYSALHQYLTFLWVPDPLTLFEGIYKLPAGHYAIWKNSQLQLTKYWDLSFPENGYVFSANESELAEELRERFVATVKSQMLSDVPLGAFLSAGLDSSSIVAAMHQVSHDPIRTFTIGFPAKYRKGETTLDDTDVARRTANRFGCIHKDIVVEPDIVSLLPKLIWYMDEPVADPALITSYLVCREARKDVTVLLSGVGGDELFAGYRKYRAHYLARSYQAIPQILRKGIIEPFLLALPGFRGSSLKGTVRLAKKMARSGSLSSRDRFIMDSVYLTDSQKQELYTSDIAPLAIGTNPRLRHIDYFDSVASADFLNQMLYVDTKAFMTSLNLTYNDKMSMASSVEVRVPFLDWELAEWAAWNVPPELKVKSGMTKHILREAMRPLLPPEVLQQKKAGFGAPADYWLANDLREMVDDLLSESTLKKRGLFNPQVIRRYVEEQRRGKEDWSLQIWQFLTLELWMQQFID
jgi:asparagine synthase (glutamine-hydrolysing)